MKIRMDIITNDAISRPAGYANAMISHGTVSGSVLIISPVDYSHLRVEYSPIAPAHVLQLSAVNEARPAHRMTGWGDVVEVVAQPIARSIDRVFGTNVAGCKKCKKRKATLNKMFPFK